MDEPGARVLADRFPRWMGPADAVMWDIEKDPVLRSTITAVAILDRAPDWERLVAKVERASRVIPRLRQRVVIPPLRVGAPQWVVDPEFDLRYHLRRVRVPAPGTLREVLDLAQPIAMAGFDRARPLWEFTLVEGMAGGQAALVQKLHHSLTDGVGAVELAMAILDADRLPLDDEPMPPVPEAGATHPAAVFSDALGQRARSVTGGLLGLPMELVRAAAGIVADPIGSVTRARTLGGSIGKILAPVPESASPLLRDRSLSRHFDTIEVPLADLKAAAHACGGTVNDAFLAGAVEGLRRYHQANGVELVELRLTMPINLRTSDSDLGGNRFAPARFAVPAGIRDPAQRMRELGAIARAWQVEPALAFTDSLAFVLDRLPVTVTTGIFGAMLKHIDAVVTNVPGIPVTSYLAGAEVVKEYAFAPCSGAAVNIALLSHIDTACIGIVVDTAAVGDDAALVAAMVEGFDDVLAVAGHHAERTA